MIHRTFRSLDEAPKLVGFTVRQWGALIAASALALAVIHIMHVPAKPAITLCVFTIGLPAALTYVSESGGLALGQLLRDMCRWRLRSKSLRTGVGEQAAGRAIRRRRATTADLLGVEAITPDGLLVTREGSYVRYLQTAAVNPLVMDPGEAERVGAAFAQVAARLPDRQSLQLYLHATPLALEELLAQETHRCEQAAGAAQDSGQARRAQALRGLGIAQEQSIRRGADTVAPLRLRYLVVCPWQPSRSRLPSMRAGKGPLRIAAQAHERNTRESLRHSEGIRRDLETLGLPARALAGGEVLDLLQARFDPQHAEAGGLPASFLHPAAVQAPEAGEDAGQAGASARLIADAVCSAAVELSRRSHLRIGGHLEQVLHLSLPPEQTWLGWLLHMTQAPRPFTLAVHIHATERYRERMAQKRRYKRLFGVNRGIEQRGRPLDPDARLAEQEAAELTEELTTSAGAGIYRLSIYLAIREPDGDAEALAELAAATARELTMASDARVQHGAFAQEQLWCSTLPLGRDAARRQRRYVTRNVGDSFPLVGTSCGSPDGIPLGYALPGRTLERLDPFDPAAPKPPAARSTV